MEKEEGAKGGFTEVFLSKLKEQSFTIILMVGMLIYQNKIYNEQVDMKRLLMRNNNILIS